jgi:hypothetical protein
MTILWIDSQTIITNRVATQGGYHFTSGNTLSPDTLGFNISGSTGWALQWRDGSHLARVGIEFSAVSLLNVYHERDTNSANRSTSYVDIVTFRSGNDDCAFVGFTAENALNIVVSASVVASATTSLTSNTWHRLEYRFFLDASTGGQVEVHLSGAELLSFTGITAATGIVAINRVAIRGATNTAGSLGRDRTGAFVVFEGDDPASLLGSTTRVHAMIAVGDDTPVDWIPNTGTNWQRVDEVPNMDDDTSFNSSNTSGDIDRYLMSQNESTAVGISGMASDAVVKGVMVRGMARGSGGTDILRLLYGYSGFETSGGSNTTGGSTVSNTTTYSSFNLIVSVPPGGGAWTQSAVLSATTGIEHA